MINQQGHQKHLVNVISGSLKSVQNEGTPLSRFSLKELL